MSKKLLIRDLTLRDGQQSLFATRMKQDQVNRVLPFYKDANFYAMEVWGGAVPDSVMRYLKENPWHRLQSIKAAVGDTSKLTALSRGRNLFGYTPYTDQIIDGFCKNAINSGLGIMRIFDALNDINNVKSTIKYVKEHGGIADCAVCYTIDPEYSEKPQEKSKGLKKLFGNKSKQNEPKKVFTDKYFLDKAKSLEELGADMITIKDMSGLIPPSRVGKLISLFKSNLKIPVDFHTHCTPGYGLASVLSAIINGADIVDTNIWNFAGGPAAPAIELIYIFTKKLGIDMDVNMEAVAKINEKLLDIRKELSDVDAVKMFPISFNPLTDTIPPEIDAEFDNAIKFAKADNEPELMKSCRKIEDYFNFPPPNEHVKKAQIPGGMYTNMVAQLKALKNEDILDDAMKLIPQVRLDSGLVPLVTPTSQIVGAQAVNCAIDALKGQPMYSNTSNQFISMVKGEYGETPIPINPDFREKICGHSDERPFDTSKYKMQENPILDDCGGVKLAENEEEELLLELFPLVAKGFLKEVKKAAWLSKQENINETKSTETTINKKEIIGEKVLSPMPGKIFQMKVKSGDKIEKGQVIVVLEAMKMENNIIAEINGYVNNILVEEGDMVAADAILMDIIDKPITQSSTTENQANVKTEAIISPMPGKILEYSVKIGEKIQKGQKLATLEAMKMENSITSETEGYVYKFIVAEGDMVAAEAPIIEITQQPINSNSAVSNEPTVAVISPMPGKILDITVKPGDTVKKDQTIAVLEAMKMENQIICEYNGIVKNILVNVGDTINADTKIIDVVEK